MAFNKRLFRFSIGGLLVVTAVAALLLAQVTLKARIQKRVVDSLSVSGGMVYYHQNRSPKPDEPPKLTWFQSLLGEHHFLTIRFILAFPDESLLSDIAQLNEVEHLVIDARRLTDPEAFVVLRSMNELNSLRISYAVGLESVNLEALLDLPKLEHVSISSAKVDDEDLQQILQIPSLRRLDIKQTYITPEAADAAWDQRPDVEIYYQHRVKSPSLFP